MDQRIYGTISLNMFPKELNTYWESRAQETSAILQLELFWPWLLPGGTRSQSRSGPFGTIMYMHIVLNT